MTTYMHPDHLQALKGVCLPNSLSLGSSLETPIGDVVGQIFSEPIVSSYTIPKTAFFEEWEVPESKSKFYSYGPEDEAWMRPLGIGVRKVEKEAYFQMEFNNLLGVGLELSDIMMKQFEEEVFKGYRLPPEKYGTSVINPQMLISTCVW